VLNPLVCCLDLTVVSHKQCAYVLNRDGPKNYCAHTFYSKQCTEYACSQACQKIYHLEHSRAAVVVSLLSSLENACEFTCLQTCTLIAVTGAECEKKRIQIKITFKYKSVF